MSNSRHPRPSDAEAIEATAAAWLAQRDDGFTSEQESEFVRWRGADVRHEAAVARLEATWTALQQLREFRPEAARHPDRDLLRASAGRRRAVPFPALAATVALAASLVLATVWWFASPQPRGDSAWQTHSTTLDGYERVALADGSIVELNSASEVRVRFFPVERHVRLVRGEAHFTVAKNPTRPFLVEAGSVAVRAVGTAFNVRLGANAIEVLVTAGRVAVATPEAGIRTPEARSQTPEDGRRTEDSERGQLAAPKLGEGGRAAVGDQTSEVRSQRSTARTGVAGTADGRVYAELGANERIVIPAVRGSAAATPVALPVIEKVAPEAVREALAWQGPRLVFVDTPLADAIAQFNRRNPVQLELADTELGALPIGGSFRAENVDAFVRLLASGGDVAVERPTPTRIVLKKVGRAPRPD